MTAKNIKVEDKLEDKKIEDKGIPSGTELDAGKADNPPKETDQLDAVKLDSKLDYSPESTDSGGQVETIPEPEVDMSMGAQLKAMREADALIAKDKANKESDSSLARLKMEAQSAIDNEKGLKAEVAQLKSLNDELKARVKSLESQVRSEREASQKQRRTSEVN